jgi:hypothetical protein
MNVNRLTRLRILRWAGAVTCLLHVSGCLNPTFVNQVTGGRVAPLAPGNAPFVQVLVINATVSADIDIILAWTPPEANISAFTMQGIGPNVQLGKLLQCPVDMIGLGTPTDPVNTPAMVVRNNGVTTNVPASAFPLVFRNGQDFQCGDTIVLGVIDDATSGYGVKIVSGRVNGSSQTGPFSGPDTFQIVQGLLIANGSPPIPIP